MGEPPEGGRWGKGHSHFLQRCGVLLHGGVQPHSWGNKGQGSTVWGESGPTGNIAMFCFGTRSGTTLALLLQGPLQDVARPRSPPHPSCASPLLQPAPRRKPWLVVPAGCSWGGRHPAPPSVPRGMALTLEHPSQPGCHPTSPQPGTPLRWSMAKSLGSRAGGSHPSSPSQGRGRSWKHQGGSPSLKQARAEHPAGLTQSGARSWEQSPGTHMYPKKPPPPPFLASPAARPAPPCHSSLCTAPVRDGEGWGGPQQQHPSLTHVRGLGRDGVPGGDRGHRLPGEAGPLALEGQPRRPPLRGVPVPAGRVKVGGGQPAPSPRRGG